MFKKNKYNPLDKRTLKEFNKIRNNKKNKLLCNAPFSTLFFTEYGEILPCYYNKNIVFGKYPQQSPEDAWFGDKMNTLREHIKHNSLDFGCQDCKQYIQNKNYYSTGAWRYDYLPINKSKYPISLDFQISNICNLSCIMCNGEYSQTVRQRRECKEKYENPYDNEFIEQITPFITHLKEAAFTGGEAFIIKQYFDIWDKIYEINPNIRISITTNGTILNSRVKSYLEKLNFNITLSLDSLEKKNFEEIRRLSKFEDVINNLEFFIAYTKSKKTLFTVKICPMRQNWHELPAIVNFLNSKNVFFQFNNVIFPPYCSLWNLSSAELINIITFLRNSSFTINTDIQKSNIERFNNLISQLINWKEQSIIFEKKYPNINLLDANELNNILQNNIDEYFLTNKELLSPTSFGYDTKEIFNKLLLEIKDKDILKNAFIYFVKIPIHRIISEFNIRDFDKIIERTIQAGQVKPTDLK